MPDIKLFQIVYSQQTLENIPPGYLVMDNLDGTRKDWREYWPIRKFLLTQALSEDCYYGFFSPRFLEKTGLDHAQALDFIRSAPAGTDLVTFSPQPDMGAFFLNVFEQNEVFDPGFIPACEAFLSSIGMSLKLGPLVMDSRQIVFSNYFVARPDFWRAWLDINEKLFAISEGADSALRQMVNHATTYNGIERKVFLMERIVSLLLTIDTKWKSHCYNTFSCAWSASKLGENKLDAVMSDALKIAIREQGFPQYLTAFAALRDKLRGN